MAPPALFKTHLFSYGRIASPYSACKDAWISFISNSVSLPYFAIESREICCNRSGEKIYVFPRKYLSKRAKIRMIGMV